jgi:hypothetical protein
MLTRHTRPSRLVFVITALALFVTPACSSDDGASGGSRQDSSSAQDTTGAGDSLFPDQGGDALEDQASGDGSETPDTSLPDEASTDSTLPEQIGELPTGEGAPGDPCAGGADCASGLCWATPVVSGCTMSCTGQAACEDLGAICIQMTGTTAGCSPTPVSSGVTCSDSKACVFPTWCRSDMGQCEILPCWWDEDCGEGMVCDALLRRCQVATCVSDYECKRPGLVCREGACVPPECAKDADCDAGRYCEPNNKVCADAGPCNDEGACDLYNLRCVDALCIPNRCLGCAEGQACDPDTGECGPACQSPTDCDEGFTCISGGVCVENVAPWAAARIQAGGGLHAALDVQLGSEIQLDATASLDSNGDPLNVMWSLNSAPPGSAYLPGTDLGNATTWTFTPDVPGHWFFGLWVSDAAGAVSFQDQAVVYVWEAL